ncbi:MAG TPA: hypothetical protein VIQ74_17805 [Gemmatimonadaceae bacterium]
MSEIDVTRRGTTERIIERPAFRVSWGAVFAGLVVALALQAVLTLLGTAIGLTALDGATGREFGIGAGIWLILSILVSLYVGGLVTGRLAGVLTRGDGALHGVLMWGLSTVLGLYLLASGVSSLLGGAVQLASSGAAGTAGTAAQGGRVAQSMDSAARSMMDTIQESAGEVVSNTREGAARGAWFALLGLALSAGAAALGAAQKAHD